MSISLPLNANHMDWGSSMMLISTRPIRGMLRPCRLAAMAMSCACCGSGLKSQVKPG